MIEKNHKEYKIFPIDKKDPQLHHRGVRRFFFNINYVVMHIKKEKENLSHIRTVTITQVC